MGFDIYLELRAIIAALNAEGLDYALCGGLALAVHAEPRATKDIDLLVREEDLPRLRLLLKALDYTVEALPMAFASGLEVKRISKLGEDDLFTVDLVLVNELLLSPWETRQELSLDGERLWVVSRAGLIEMKRLAGRPQDLADIHRLERS